MNVAEVVDRIRLLADRSDEGKAARNRIALTALDADEVKAHPEAARDLLVNELASIFVDLLAEVTRLEREGVALDGDAEGMLALDLALVRVLERVDADEGARAREGRTTKATDPALRWELWSDDDKPVGLVRFAGVVWSRRVRERWRRGVDRPAAMVRVLAHDKLGALARGAALDEGTGEVRDGKGSLVAGLVPGLDVATLDLEVMRRGLEVFRSTLARRAIRFFAHEAHRGDVRGDLRPEIVCVDGGLVGLAEAIGCHPRKDAQRVRDLLDLGRVLDVSTPGLEVHGLWHWTVIAEAPGRRARLEVDLNRWVFLEGAAERLKVRGVNTREARLERLLVPVLRHDPPFRVAQRRERGRVWTVADAVLVVLVDNGAELAAEGGTRIDSKAWKRLVDEAGLDEGRASIVRDLMLTGDGTSPPLLARVSGDRFTLAPDRATELAFILARSTRKRGDT